jgi:hypothetical protein
VKAGSLLSAQATAAFFTPQVLRHVQDDWKQMYGYGMEFAVAGTGEIMFAQKEGNNVGVSAVIRHYPDQDINVILLANIQHGAWEPLRTIHHLLKEGEEQEKLVL